MPLKALNAKNSAKKSEEIRFEFDAIIQKHATLNSCYVNFNCDIQKDFGAKQAKIKVWFDDYLYRGLLKRMGCKHMNQLTGLDLQQDNRSNKCDENNFVLLINQEVRKAINKGGGDTVHVIVEKDNDERVADIPQFMQDKLAKHDSLEQFKKLCFTSQKEWCKKIAGAKKEETKERMLLHLLEIL